MPKLPFVPKEEKFFDLFELSAHNMVRAAQELKNLADTWDDIEEKVAFITEMEHEGDSLTHRIIAQLHTSFITPFDREDIARLANSMDDVIDLIEDAALAMFIYKIPEPSQRAKELADIIVQEVSEVERAIPKLRNRKDLKNIIDHCVEINRLENKADRVYRSAQAELFDNTTNVVQIIKWREIYQHMESATDHCEDIADILEGVALKHA